MRAALARLVFVGYKGVVSPVIHAVGLSQCIFLPTCSEYAYTAVVRYGWVKGTGLALKRISKCHPLHQGGIDEVP